ncbi:MAG: hypothetical protein PHH77_07155 [Victivallaceae bacterium]|nr:hypothetical protein [Victivallaceae bacterium]
MATYDRRDFPATCEICGAIVSRGEKICESCLNDNDKTGGPASQLHNWCRLCNCDYNCQRCAAYLDQMADKIQLQDAEQEMKSENYPRRIK